MRNIVLTLLIGLLFACFVAFAFAADAAPAVQGKEEVKDYTAEMSGSAPKELAITEVKPLPAGTTPAEAVAASETSGSSAFDPVKYTLGADDVIEINVMRHPEFSGDFIVNQESKIQFKFIGDLDVNGLTKKQVEEKIVNALSGFIKNPEVNVTIKEYKSKYILVIGEVGTPGRYYIRAEEIPVRDAIVAAGLPLQSAAMRKAQIITPGPRGRKQVKKVNLYELLYAGDLSENVKMRPGEILYVPSTIMAKVVRVINPVASTIGVASSGPTQAGSAKTAVDTIAR